MLQDVTDPGGEPVHLFFRVVEVRRHPHRVQVEVGVAHPDMVPPPECLHDVAPVETVERETGDATGERRVDDVWIVTSGIAVSRSRSRAASVRMRRSIRSRPIAS